MIQTIKKNMVGFKRSKFKDGVQDGRQLGSYYKTYLTKKLDIKHFNFDFFIDL